jgi:hypothetical protein
MTPNKIDTTRPVVCAALRQGYRIICGPRHFDPVMRQQILASEGTGFWRGSEQGFVNTWGEFLTREEALIVALVNEQRVKRCGGDDDKLFSENLY